MSQSSARERWLVPIRFSKHSHLALEFALSHSLTRTGGAEIYLFYCYEKRWSDFRQLTEQNERTLELMADLMNQAITALAEKGEHHSVDVVQRRFGSGDPARAILSMAGAISADMVIMGKPRSFRLVNMLRSMPCSTVLICEKDIAFVTPETERSIF